MSNYDSNFINIELTRNTVYIYSVRKLLQRAIDKNLKNFKGILLDLGCGEMPYREYLMVKNKKIRRYIGMDVNYNNYHNFVKPDMVWDGEKIGLSDKQVNTVIATELFEHVPNIEKVLREISRVLSDDGILFFTVPFIWPLHETPFDEFRYTPYSLKRFLKKAGFQKIKIATLGQYNASLAQMICIWIFNQNNLRKSYFQEIFFHLFEKFILFPIIKKLLIMDKKERIINYGENTIPTGFYVYAKK